MKQLQFDALPPKDDEVLKQVAQSCGCHNYFGLCPKKRAGINSFVKTSELKKTVLL